MEKYTERSRSVINISEAARRAGATSQRFRRAVRKLRIPVSRSGWTVLIEARAVERVKKAWASGLISPGRPKKKRVDETRLSFRNDQLTGNQRDKNLKGILPHGASYIKEFTK